MDIDRIEGKVDDIRLDLAGVKESLSNVPKLLLILISVTAVNSGAKVADIVEQATAQIHEAPANAIDNRSSNKELGKAPRAEESSKPVSTH